MQVELAVHFDCDKPLHVAPTAMVEKKEKQNSERRSVKAVLQGCFIGSLVVFVINGMSSISNSDNC